MCGVGQVGSDRLPGDACLRLVPAQAGAQPVRLQPNEGAESQEDVRLLGSCASDLGLLGSAALLDAPVAGSRCPIPASPGTPASPPRGPRVAGRPVLRAPLLEAVRKTLTNP